MVLLFSRCCIDLPQAPPPHTHKHTPPPLLLTWCAGIAHLLEHMAFKGTPAVGSKDWGKEAPLLLAVDEGAVGHAQMSGVGEGCMHPCLCYGHHLQL